MRAPLISTTIGDTMNNLYENACEDDNKVRAFVKGFGIGALEGLAMTTMMIGSAVVLTGVSNMVSGNNEK